MYELGVRTFRQHVRTGRALGQIEIRDVSVRFGNATIEIRDVSVRFGNATMSACKVLSWCRLQYERNLPL